MAAGLRIDLHRGLRAQRKVHPGEPFVWGWDYRWRLWSSSAIIAASSEGYDRQSRAIANLETVTGGQFRKISTPDFPTPYGILSRETPNGYTQGIPVRLVES